MTRYMYIPVIKKIVYQEEVLVERNLPKEGEISISVGEQVDPSSKMGSCKVSYNEVILGTKFKFSRGISEKGVVEKDIKVGKVGKSNFYAPFKGYLVNEDGNYVFKSEEKDYLLLPGVWGEVVDISENTSVLLKTQLIDVHLPIATKKVRSGELIVFPNPSGILALQYFENYVKSASGKIIYVGNYATQDLMKKAIDLNVSAILAGSASRSVYDLALSNQIALGLFTGFGEMNTPEVVYNYLNDITNRYVFFVGEKNSLRVPISKDVDGKITKSKPKNILKYVKKGLKVQVFNTSKFGQIGVVDRVSKSSIFVEFGDEAEVVEVKPPNVFAIE